MRHRLRRVLLVSIAIVTCTALTYGPAAAQVQQETSAITGVERVSSTGMRDTQVLNYAGSDIAYKAEYTFQPETGAETWMLFFYGFAAQRTDFVQAERVLVWIGGQRRQIDEAEPRMRPMNDEVLEIQTVTVSPAVFQRIAEAEAAVQFVVGSAEFDLSYTDRADMRAVVDQARQIATSAVSQQQRAVNAGR